MQNNAVPARELTALRRRYVNLRDELIELGWPRQTVRRYMEGVLTIAAVKEAVEFFEALVHEERGANDAYYRSHTPLADDQLEFTLTGVVDPFDVAVLVA